MRCATGIRSYSKMRMNGHGDHGHDKKMMWLMALCCALPLIVLALVAFFK